MSASNVAEWPPELTVFPVSKVELRVVEGDHPYFVANEQQIAANWKQDFGTNPQLFNGRMMLSRDVQVSNGTIIGIAHVISYATFLLWRKLRPVHAGVHVFALPVIVSSDGAVIAARMGAHTSNPGRVYCAAGSLDPDDIRDGFCDLEHNMAREVMEETGIDLGDAVARSPSYALHERGAITVFRTYRFDATAEEFIARICDHMAHDPHSEIDAAVAIRSADPDLHPYNPFMPPILEWVLGKGG